MVNAVPMPRYGGRGCRMMAVSQGVGTAIVDVLVTYTNSDGVPGRQVTATLNLAAPAGTLASSSLAGAAAAAPCGPYLGLAAGDTGVLSVEQIEPLAAGGGIFALVIVKPLLDFGMHEATVAPIEVDCLADRSLMLPELEPGAHLALIAQGTTTASPALTAQIETIWG